MDGPVKKKRRFSQKVVCLLLAVVLAAAGGVGGYAWWESQPAQRFAYWEMEGQPPPVVNGITIILLMLAGIGMMVLEPYHLFLRTTPSW